MTSKNYIKLGIVSIISFIIFSTCSKDEVTPREYPRVKTLEVNEIISTGARFNAEILYTNKEIIEYGFVWANYENPTIDHSDKKVTAENIGAEHFSAKISTTLREGETYYVRAYAKNNNYLVYGKVVSFTNLGSKAPELIDFLPKEGEVGDTIHIVGQNFSYLYDKNVVRFNEIKAEILDIDLSDSTINVVVPKEIDSLYSKITIEIDGNRSNTLPELFHLAPVNFIGISPKKGTAGDTITINGNHFGSELEIIEVRFDTTRAKIIDGNSKSITIIVPYLEKERTYSISTQVGFQSLEPIGFDYFKSQLFSPTEVTWGDTVTVKTNYLFNEDAGIKILLNGKAQEIISKDNFGVKFKIPNDLYATEALLQLANNGSTITFEDSVKLKEPEIISVSPSIISFGDLVTIEGKYFHPTINYLSVFYYDKYDGKSSASTVIQENTPNKLTFTFPYIKDNRGNNEGDNILELFMWVGGYNGFKRNAPIELVKPSIVSFSPTEVNNAGDQITITGSGFDSNTVVEYNSKELDILTVSENQIEATIPTSLISNPIIGFKLENPIVVRNGNRMEATSTENLTFNYQTPWTNADVYDSLELSYRKYFSAWENQSKGYILGGFRGSSYYGTAYYYDDFWEFDPATYAWKRLADVPYTGQSKRMAFGAGNYSFLILGSTIGSLVMLRYEHATDTWESLTSLPQEIVQASTDAIFYFSLNNRHFVITRSAETIYEYLVETDKWVKVTNSPNTFSLYHYPYNGKEIINYGSYNYEFDPTTSNLTQIGSSNIDRNIIEYNGIYYAYFSFNDVNLYEFDPANITYSSIAEFPIQEQYVKKEYCFTINDVHYFLNGTYILGYDPNF